MGSDLPPSLPPRGRISPLPLPCGVFAITVAYKRPSTTPTTPPVGGIPPCPLPPTSFRKTGKHISPYLFDVHLANARNWGAAAPLAPLRPSLRHCGAGCLLPLGVALCGSALPRPERFLVCFADVSLYVLLAPSSRPMGGARICGASCARGPPPRACGLGGPPPLLACPAPCGRAPPRWSGLWEIGLGALPPPFLSAVAALLSMGARRCRSCVRRAGRVLRSGRAVLRGSLSLFARLLGRHSRRLARTPALRPLRSRFARPRRPFRLVGSRVNWRVFKIVVQCLSFYPLSNDRRHCPRFQKHD